MEKETQEAKVETIQPNPDVIIYHSCQKLEEHIERIDKLGQVLENNDEAVETMEIPVIGGLFQDLAHLMDEEFGKLRTALSKKGIDIEKEPKH